ncbi:hypothetical protein LTR56_000519 [Elasticomyces elasticus]|nr:hypothetical protein LTR22_014247 [Elasticomyces elasticus]KAK3660761.1 hypothetical protein LTR56_000519 [Elasticomyces elasticus]KAK4922907.1 hypothetical protein LTR49_009914 [Elasticomyces elasticus]KAK5736000.1 hypothetical protein LTS12_026312 [Elasticomyces elasticus]
MAGQPPDPRTFESWEDAFQYPLPVVRKLEQQLRKNIDENRQKLRSLVGASYRDLLGTAERIIEMDEQIKTVESNLSDIGRKCNARAVGRVGENHAKMRMTRNGREYGRDQTMAQTKVLESTLSASARMMREGGDALTVAKLLVLSRLLHKSVGHSGEASSVIENHGRKLASLRRKLLAFIGRSMQRPVTDKTYVARTLCAYALVTSSSAKDVLKHFLQVRLQLIEAKAESYTESAVLQMLDLYRQTLDDARSLFPKLFAESLSHLGKSPLLQDAQLQSLSELSLDVYGVWIAPDVQSFTPWVRHEQLLSSEVHEGLNAWSRHVEHRLLEAVTVYLRTETDAHAVVSARKEIVSQYLSLLSASSNNAESKAVEQLRSLFLDRLKSLAEDCAREGSFVLDDLDAVGTTTLSSVTTNIWQLASKDFDGSRGALHLRQAVLQGRHGRDEGVRMLCGKLDSWIERLQALSDITQRMRSTKWDEADFDFDDLEDGDAILECLAKEDPETIRSTLRKATSDAVRQIDASVQSAFESRGDEKLLLRLLRELDRRKRTLIESIGVTDDIEVVFADLVPSLHRQLAENVATRVFEQTSDTLKKHTVVPVSLWDGLPALPIQPSPSTYKLLAMLQRIMSDAGTDLWSPAAVTALKSNLEQKLVQQLTSGSSIESEKARPTTNGHTNIDETPNNDMSEHTDAGKGAVLNCKSKVCDTRHNYQIQQLFDVLYLQRVMRHRNRADGSALQDVATELADSVKLDKASSERLHKSANEYWKRTYLLFGLLAPSSS